MKLALFFHIIGLSLYLGTCSPLLAKAQNINANTTTYTIKQGETTYRIAKNHGITVDQLLAVNPGMNPDHIQANMVINVPKGSQVCNNQGRMTAATNIKKHTPARYQQLTDSIVYKEYKVKRKDTAYSLAKANGISVDELMKANPQLEERGYKLKRGKIIRIPVKIKIKKIQKTGMDTVRVAIVLPFIGRNDENIRSIEFYQGMLLGIEELKKANKSIFVSAYNEPHIDESIKALIKNVKAKHPDVIVGPLYPSHFSDVTACADNKTKIAIPFSSKIKQVDYTPNVFAFNTPISYRNEIGIELFTSSFKTDANIIFLHKKGGDKKEFCSLLQTEVIKKGYNLLSLDAASSAEDIKEAITGRKGHQFVIVPDDSDIETLKDLLPKMDFLRSKFPANNFALLGFSTWIELSEGELRNKFHENDIYILAPNYYFPYTSAAIDFNNRYKHWFKSDLLNTYPKMAPLGYDFSIGFLGGLINYGHKFGSNNPQANTIAASPKLQNEIRFERVNAQGGYVSRSMWLVHFRKDMTITKTNAR